MSWNCLDRGKLAVGTAALWVAISGCGGTPGSEVGVKEVVARPNAEGTQVVDVDVHSFYFEPNRIVVEAGKPVEIALHFRPWFVPHNMTLLDPAAGFSIDKGIGIVSFDRTKRVHFTPFTPGEYRFFCGVGGHRTKGMEGTIVVR